MDDREGRGDHPMTEAAADHFGEDNTTVKRLKTGDIVAPDVQAAAERKEISDFLGSLNDTDSGGRIWKQMRAMEEQYDHCSLVVEGSHIESWVADIYGGHAAAIKKVIGVCAYFNNREGWSAFWIQSNGAEGKRLLCTYLEAWFRQVEKKQEKNAEEA